MPCIVESKSHEEKHCMSVVLSSRSESIKRYNGHMLDSVFQAIQGDGLPRMRHCPLRGLGQVYSSFAVKGRHAASLRMPYTLHPKMYNMPYLNPAPFLAGARSFTPRNLTPDSHSSARNQVEGVPTTRQLSSSPGPPCRMCTSFQDRCSGYVT